MGRECPASAAGSPITALLTIKTCTRMNTRTLTAALSITLAGFTATAQTSYLPASNFIDGNNIKALINADGTLFYRNSDSTVICEYPKNTGRHFFTGAHLWIGGFDTQGQLKVAAQTHGLGDNRDFWSGILNQSNQCSPVVSAAWNHVWKMTRTDIEQFRAAYNSGNPSNIPASVREWPAAGNVNAKGANGTDIYQYMIPGRQYAPFIDADADGIYNPTQGDYPKIQGEQMMWIAYNDMVDVKQSTGSLGIGLEIHASMWCYKRNTIADNIVFVKYDVHNRGNLKLDSCKMALWANPDLGELEDDYAGVDTLRGMGYVYNSQPTDGSGQPGSGTYGANPPAAGVLFLQNHGFNSFLVNRGFLPYEQTEPHNAAEFYKVMTGHTIMGTPINPIFDNNYFMFNDKPGTGPDDECTLNNGPSDRRFTMATGLFTLLPQSTEQVTMAFFISPDAGGCPNVDLTGLNATADTARNLFDSPPPSPTSVTPISRVPFRLYPNPTSDELILEAPKAFGPRTSCKVFDMLGREVLSPRHINANRIVLHTKALASGVYLIRLQDEDTYQTLQFVRE